MLHFSVLVTRPTGQLLLFHYCIIIQINRSLSINLSVDSLSIEVDWYCNYTIVNESADNQLLKSRCEFATVRMTFLPFFFYIKIFMTIFIRVHLEVSSVFLYSHASRSSFILSQRKWKRSLHLSWWKANGGALKILGRQRWLQCNSKSLQLFWSLHNWREANIHHSISIFCI